MPKYRVPIAGTVGKTIVIDTDKLLEGAKGATIGTDLKLPDGTVPSLEELAAVLNLAAPAILPYTIWSLVQEIPDNVLEVAALAGEGVVFRSSTGTWVVLNNAQVTALVNVFTTTLKGAVPAPGAGAADRVLRADGTWGTVSSGAPQQLFYAGAF